MSESLTESKISTNFHKFSKLNFSGFRPPNRLKFFFLAPCVSPLRHSVLDARREGSEAPLNSSTKKNKKNDMNMCISIYKVVDQISFLSVLLHIKPETAPAHSAADPHRLLPQGYRGLSHCLHCNQRSSK